MFIEYGDSSCENICYIQTDELISYRIYIPLTRQNHMKWTEVIYLDSSLKIVSLALYLHAAFLQFLQDLEKGQSGSCLARLAAFGVRLCIEKAQRTF